MLDKVREAASRLAAERRELASVISGMRSSNSPPPCSKESALVIPVCGSPPGMHVCGVDGGLLHDRMHGADILLARAVAVSFCYERSSVKSFSHHPGRFPAIELEIRTGLDEHEAMQWKSLSRLRHEVSAAIAAVERLPPGLLLMDGSILPLPCDRPPESSRIYAQYSGVISLYKRLYSACDCKGWQLLGVVKDSRGKRLTESLGQCTGVPDTVFTSHLLLPNERTCALPYSDSQKQPVLADLGEYSGRFGLFYLRPSDDDLPLRVEYLESAKTPGEIASEVCFLSSISRAFAYPAVLIEADMCAALDPVEMETVKSQISGLSGGLMRPLRRNARPFR